MVVQADTATASACMVLSVKGGLSHADREELFAAVNRAAHPGCTRMLLDLREVPFVDSKALGLLAMTYHQLKRRQIEFGLLKPTEAVLKLLTISGIPKIIPIFRTEPEELTRRAA